MTVKKDLLKEIEKKAQRIKDKRKEVANRTLETHAYEFFKNVEEALKLNDPHLTMSAYSAFVTKVRLIDPFCEVEVVWREGGNDVQGVCITWSETYRKDKEIEPEAYIDISQMLLADLFTS